MSLKGYLPIVAMCGLLQSCTSPSVEVDNGRGEFIITVALPDGNAAGAPSDADKAYGLGVGWQVPIGVRKVVRLLAKDYGFRIVDTWPLYSIHEYCIVTDRISDVESLSRDGRVTSVQPIHRFVAMDSAPPHNDAELKAQLGGNVDALNRLHEWSTGNGVKVGIIDTPIDVRHPDLEHRIKSQTMFVPATSNISDLVHGTAVAGIIGAEANNGIGIVGFAPDTEIYGYGACRFSKQGSHTVCNTFSLAKAIEAAGGDHLDVLNLSLAGPYDALLDRLLEAVIGKGVIVVAADNPGSTTLRFPAMMAGVIAVSTLNDDRAVSPTPVRIEDEHLSTVPGGGYRYFYGSSMSAARVAALVSLLLEKSPALTEQGARNSLRSIANDCARDSLAGACAMRFALVDDAPAFSMGRATR